ncbi:MAG: hypothetical protein VW337_05770, partial [Gammaproteobacteria bacterium]
MDEKIPYASAIATAGWWSGYGFIGGAIALTLGGESIGLAWPEVYRAMIIFMLVLMVAVMFSPNPMTAFDEQNLSSSGKEVYSVPQTSGWLK